MKKNSNFQIYLLSLSLFVLIIVFFSILRFRNQGFVFVDNYYSRVGNLMYCDENVLTGADISSFFDLTKDINSDIYAKDKYNVYYYCDILTGADIVTFETETGNYAKDKNNVYYFGNVFTGADSATFRILTDFKKFYSYLYAIDDKNVYYNGNIVSGSDVATFQNLNNYYAKDKNNVYYEQFIITGADLISFKLNKYFKFAQDKNNVYYEQFIITGADSLSFEILCDGPYARDKNHIYYEKNIVTGANLTTFRCLNGVKTWNVPFYYDAIDKDNKFLYGTIAN